MSYLAVYWKRYWKLFLASVAFLSVEACCDLLQPTIVSKIIDEGVASGQIAVVLRFAFVMLGVTALGAVGAVGRNQLASRVSHRFGADLRLDIFKKINAYSFEELGRRDAAGLLTRMTNDTTQLQHFANGMMRIFAKAPILGIGAFIMVFFLNPRLLWFLLAVIPIVIVLIVTSLKVGAPFFVKLQAALDRLNAAAREYLSGVRVVKAFNTFDQEVKRFGDVNEALSGIAIRVGRVMSMFNPLITLAMNMAVVALLWLARPLMETSDVKVGQIIAFMNYMAQILQAVNMVFNVYQQFIRARASAHRVGDVLSFSPKEQAKNGAETARGTRGFKTRRRALTRDVLLATDAASAIEAAGGYNPDTITGHIEFKNVTFIYPDTKTPVLRDVSFDAHPGETVGIIGSTGAGKSSLVNLVPGFYHPQAGEVLLDGVKLEEYDLVALREKISVVAQKAQLFTGTIAENIRWGKMEADDEALVEAAKAAQAHDFIASFPDGYDTLLGQNGVNLSGGQKQRVSIARALVRQSKVLILDDCVSAVDAATEAAILQALRREAADVTCLMVTQRIASVMHLPKILVLDGGAAVGFGNHEVLMDSCEVYREIYRSQVGKGR